MATANFTGDEQQQIIAQLFCSADLTAGTHDHLTFVLVLNSFLSITAFLGNVLVLVALRKDSSLHPPSKLLLRNLATTDLCVGLIAEPLFVAYLLSILNKHWNICRNVTTAYVTISSILCEVSLYTLTAISVDRLLALLLGLRYKQVVTFKRTYAIIITFWVVCIVVSAMIFWNRLILGWCTVISFSLCLVISMFSYTKIFFNLRHHQTQLQDQAQQPNQANQLNIVRYRKAVNTALWLQLTLVVCYLPYCIVLALSLTYDSPPTSVFLAGEYTATLIFLNSSLNPILYCWKIEEVRQAVKATIRQVLCCSSS